jgi:hypothetical protein
MDQRSVPAAARARADDDSLVEKAHHSIVPLDPLAFCHDKLSVPALARRFLLTQWLPVLAREAEQPLGVPALGTAASDGASKVALFGARMMLDGQLERDDAAGIAPERREKVGVTGVAVSGDALSGECFQVG